jgi:hypothetical protein
LRVLYAKKLAVCGRIPRLNHLPLIKQIELWWIGGG